MSFERFHYHTPEEVQAKAAELGVTIPFSQDFSVLNTPLTFGSHTLHNRIAIQPMEGCDGTAAGVPDELTTRRYLRFAQSGAGLIWFEATAIVPEGRANPRQMYLCEENVDAYKRLLDQIRETSMKKFGYAPFLICQLTHSGRYSKPQGGPAPLIAYNNPIFEKDSPIESSRILSDEYLFALEEKFGQAAALAERAGFDGADIKSCHRYLLSELLSAYTREGAFGGSLENRSRLLVNAAANARSATGKNFVITSRLNLYDGFPYPYGFGVPTDGSLDMNLSEGKEIIGKLIDKAGYELIDITIGNPYVNPHVNRPADAGPYDPPEHPLTGVARIAEAARQVKEAYPSLSVMSSGLSYLRQFSPYLAAGEIARGWADIAGFGRMAFAYPDFPHDLFDGRFDAKQACLACGKCSQLMRAGTVAGCVMRDQEIYLPLYKEKVLNK